MMGMRGQKRGSWVNVIDRLTATLFVTLSF
jgi:hypothetical protein